MDNLEINKLKKITYNPFINDNFVDIENNVITKADIVILCDSGVFIKN